MTAMAERDDEHASRLGDNISQGCEDLRTTQEAYRDLIENINDIVYATNADGTLTFVSPQVRQLLGYDPHELVGRHFIDLVHPDDLAIMQRAFANVLRGDLHPSDFRFLAKSGEYRWIRTSSRPVVRDGRTVGTSGFGIDIHERKLAEETLRLHSVILENMAEGTMLSRTSDQTIAHANPAFERLFGYTRGEMAGMHVSRLNAPGEPSPQAVASEIIAALQATGRWEGIVRNIKKDGSTFWSWSTISTFEHPLHGRVWVCVQGDVTERKKAEEELRESERRLKEAQAVGQIGDWEFDVEHQRIVWSDQTYRLYDRNRSLGPPTPEEEAAYYSPEQARTLREYARRAIEEGKSFDYCLEAKLPGGRQVQFSARMRPIRDANGRVIKLFGTVEDITERRRAEKELRTSERLLSTILEASPAGVALLRNRSLVWYNRTILRLFGYSAAEVRGAPVSMFYAKREEYRRIGEEVYPRLAPGSTVETEALCRRKNGSVFPVRILLSPVDDTSVLAILVDVTERKKAEEKLRSQRAKLGVLTARIETTVVRERQQIAADLHDHVGQVLGLARLEISTIAPPRSRPEQLATWRNAKRHIDQAIRFTRTLSAELHPPVLRQLGIGPALRWLARETSSKAGIPIFCRIAGPLTRLDGETAAYIYRAAQELVRNAIRHGRPKRISITFRRDARTVRLRVKDDGAGFDASRVDRPAPAKSFGLFSLRERIAAMGGSFALDTAPGKGTSVEITVPVPPS